MLQAQKLATNLNPILVPKLTLGEEKSQGVSGVLVTSDIPLKSMFGFGR